MGEINQKKIWICNCSLRNQRCRGGLAHSGPVMFFWNKAMIIYMWMC